MREGESQEKFNENKDTVGNKELISDSEEADKVIKEIPVITTNLFFGISTLMFFRLWTRAPRILMKS